MVTECTCDEDDIGRYTPGRKMMNWLRNALAMRTILGAIHLEEKMMNWLRNALAMRTILGAIHLEEK